MFSVATYDFLLLMENLTFRSVHTYGYSLEQLGRFVVCATQRPLDILYREDDEHPVLLVQPAVFHRQAHAVQQDAVQGFCIGGQTLEPWLLKKSLGNAVE